MWYAVGSKNVGRWVGNDFGWFSFFSRLWGLGRITFQVYGFYLFSFLRPFPTAWENHIPTSWLLLVFFFTAFSNCLGESHSNFMAPTCFLFYGLFQLPGRITFQLYGFYLFSFLRPFPTAWENHIPTLWLLLVFFFAAFSNCLGESHSNFMASTCFLFYGLFQLPGRITFQLYGFYLFSFLRPFPTAWENHIPTLWLLLVFFFTAFSNCLGESHSNFIDSTCFLFCGLFQLPGRITFQLYRFYLFSFLRPFPTAWENHIPTLWLLLVFFFTAFSNCLGESHSNFMASTCCLFYGLFQLPGRITFQLYGFYLFSFLRPFPTAWENHIPTL